MEDRQPAQRPVRLALIGAGSMGRNYARLIGEHAANRTDRTAGVDRTNCAGSPLSITAVVSRHEETTRWVRETLGDGVFVAPTADALYAADADATGAATGAATGDAETTLFDAVLIVTPQESHPALVEQALRHGKHVLCDKPAGKSVKQCEPMLATARANAPDLVCAMIFQQRMFARHRRIRELIRSGALGEIRRAQLVDSQYFRTVAYHHSRPWRSSWAHEGGGVLVSQGPHILDLWQWLFGMPSTVHATIPFGKYNDFAVDDESTLVMTYPNRMTGTFIITTGEGVGETRLDVQGTRGQLVMEGDLLRIWRYDRDTADYRRETTCFNASELGVEYREETLPEPDGWAAYWALMENFAVAVRSQGQSRSRGRDQKDAVEPVATLESGIRSLEIADAAYLSAWEDRTVTLPLDADRFERALQTHIAAEA
ncbi:Gfo/Idh/MocA family protein [Bifidobacterium avesanii]|uniref:Gfo/Idh/MocA family oxidoreductase n=1 Tax=Bifidobacterium avesanii TaxID=1798157 RepID=A0A7K3TJT1_9BIFI|nr:Gfo/Idh/MocA family oxidoreductase [Bifidobacterium avesanii]KAB8290922.1 oxidoreductase [Bifidobacterium avesanii]NEG78880.1 gfo/Idh/MocA family oxidoreductase [Bifidobacterium avesanii]